MRLDQFNNSIYTETDIFDLLYQSKGDQIQYLTVEPSNDVLTLEDIADITIPKVNRALESVSLEDYDKILQSEWFMPEEYKTLDVKTYCLSLCESDLEKARVLEEFEAYEDHNMIPVLQWLKYFVDKSLEEEILWGVGRGSSVASYVLFLLGVHSINSIQYNLDWREFLR